MIVLGIDPGSRRAGWGAVRQDGSRVVLLEAGVFRPPAALELAARLGCLHQDMVALLARFQPDLVGLESVFHGFNTRSLVTLGQARGAILAAVGASGVALHELAPAEIKKAVTGRGAATKEQVAHMVGAILGPAAAEHGAGGGGLDASDALAVAIATLHRRDLQRSLGAGSSTR